MMKKRIDFGVVVVGDSNFDSVVGDSLSADVDWDCNFVSDLMMNKKISK